MEKQTLGMMIASLRKEKGMTQLELADQLGITDKAVSKWERDLSCPDLASLPKLAEIFGITVDELMQIKKKQQFIQALVKVVNIIQRQMRIRFRKEQNLHLRWPEIKTVERQHFSIS